MASAPPKGQIYDSVASDYDVIWSLPCVKILFPLLDSHLRRLGPWSGTSVIDFACGTGIGLREMKRLGASKLVGVDISGEMLDVARQTSADAGFDLHHADCSQPLDHLRLDRSSFDLVIGMWLLNYADSRDMMGRMWKNVAAYLKPGAKFVGIVQNMDEVNPTSMRNQMDTFGAQETNVLELPSGEGHKMHVEFDTKPKIEFDIFVMKQDILETEARKAGMKDVTYFRPGDDLRGEAATLTESQWHELRDQYPNQLIIATKE